ncbi:MAG TPA: hypothetical protein VHM70_28900 [Polyangiaceae bacterium]|nr:hypothetical protein [Polyangiaceae bacterium]
MRSTLLACPFCREIYQIEEAEVCPVCGMGLRGLGELPPSFEVREQMAADWERLAPEDRRLPWHYWRRGRGALLLCSALGLAAFFAPWIELTKPELLSLSGFDLAQTRGFWFAGGATAWLVNLPLVASRRSVNQMRSIRIAVTAFSLLTVCQCVLLLIASPQARLVPLRYHWAWGFYLSGLASIVAGFFAITFGGTRPPEKMPTKVGPVQSSDDSKRVLH